MRISSVGVIVCQNHVKDGDKINDGDKRRWKKPWAKSPIVSKEVEFTLKRPAPFFASPAAYQSACRARFLQIRSQYYEMVTR